MGRARARRPPRQVAGRRLLVAVALLAGISLLPLARSGPSGPREPGAVGGERAPVETSPEVPGAASSAPAADDRADEAWAAAPAGPATGWEEPAAVVAADLARFVEGRPRAGAYEEARAEAARRDLARFPPERARLRRLLLGSERERVLALAALAARPDLDDDLARLVLRSQRTEDGDVVRLLGAEIVAGVEPTLLARHEDELLRAFAREPNPLVVSVALPALERMDEPRLRALLGAQLLVARAEMLPVLFALARARLAPAAVEDLEASLAVALPPRE